MKKLKTAPNKRRLFKIILKEEESVKQNKITCYFSKSG